MMSKLTWCDVPAYFQIGNIAVNGASQKRDTPAVSDAKISNFSVAITADTGCGHATWKKGLMIGVSVRIANPLPSSKVVKALVLLILVDLITP